MAELSRAGRVYDVYRALALLQSHPRIDASRIALMGPSRGGGLTVFAAMTRSLKAQLAEGMDFAAYLPFYPSISPTFDYGSLSNRPIRTFTDTADEAVPSTRAPIMHSTIPRSARHSWFALRLPRLPSGIIPRRTLGPRSR